ncbi:hypothetical protein VST7929_01675 [Vibrio stylophorae]|uniref:Methyl-accepting chemotaxis protein n=1 Tax=Vibrio stylophorae TaxID=659351 RepID=A0ABM8ZU08_9VIBR|nr:methyl-accepting chemotaxis protein [Vibrio stylophorae]CAH0533800.1 hypothetical protein VST7929_01675 [Vibrio stylophorae]
MKKQRHASILHRMYAGFALLVLLFVTTVFLMLRGTQQIQSKLDDVSQQALPLVTLSNQVSVRLLAADKEFKDYLTSVDTNRMDQASKRFANRHQSFTVAINELAKQSKTNPTLSAQVQVIRQLESSYFEQAKVAMGNYRTMLAAQDQGRISNRKFQRLYAELYNGMREVVDSYDDVVIQNISASYFAKLNDTETITSDALASSDIALVKKAFNGNRRAVTHLTYAFRGIANRAPALKEQFDPMIVAFSQAIGKKGGVLDQHLNYLEARRDLYANIAVLAGDVEKVMSLLDTFNQEANQMMDSAVIQADQAYSKAVMTAIFIGLLVTGCAAAIGYYLSILIRTPLKAILNSLEHMADGDMTHRITIENNNEFGRISRHINALAEQLQNVLRDLLHASERLANVATENQATTEKAKGQLNEQRQQTAAVATAMTQMEQSVQMVADAARQSMTKVQEVESATATGREVMSSNITTTHQLSERLDESAHVVAKVQAMSTNIGSILDVIRGIADQTNLLALNAAIEAARAGEQGRGFAVVADEVRVLAQKTTESTSEIEGMIDSLQNSSEQAVTVIQTCLAEMENSVIQASEANSAMEEIQAIILHISEMSSNIAHSADEQRRTSAEIASNLNEISLIADQSFDAMEHVAKASDMLDHQAQEQNEIVHRFTV